MSYIYNNGIYMPDKETTCLACYDVDYCLLNNNNISVLYDIAYSDSSARTGIQNTALYQPPFTLQDAEFRGHSSTTFTGSLSLFTGTWSANYQITTDYYVIKTPPTSSAYYNLLDNTDGTNFRHSFSYGPGTTVSMYAGAQVVSSTVAVNTLAVICAVYNTTSSAIYLNNATTPIATGNCGTQSFNKLRIGNYQAGYPFTGKLAYCALFSGVHTSAMRTKIMTLLGDKYGITVTV